ncbi:MAG TPA: O-succinylhomoserine sulfhydrylase, partial [Alphaproteobacteria bacterium]|nr:O-succinylhomoserine sulfhydrylase [Alphaproteobacteria bacterium]
DDYRRDTKLVRSGLERSPFQETSEALYLTSGYVYDNAEEAAAAFAGEADRYVYSRYGNPTVTMFQNRLAALEGAEACLATGTGMAGVFAALACQLDTGDRVVASRALFGACFAILNDILPRWGVTTEFVDGSDLDQWRTALSTPAKVVFFESPSNPMLDLVDISAVADMAHSAGAKVIIDNVFATPIAQKPLDLGADIVIYSATKHIDGQGRVLGGAVLADEDFIKERMLKFYRQTGPSISPFNAWVLMKSLETIGLRVERQAQTAATLAAWLEAQPGIAEVRYPGLPSHPQYDLAQRQMSNGGTLLTVTLAGGRTSAFATLNALRLIDISNNLGDSKTLACHPASTTHSSVSAEERAAMGIAEGCIRVSVGLEDVEDLKEDLERALA